ncbi:MAG: hypothetical protein GXY55_09730 [Phycisphaerae bacterium]|nr:hypothetical protein [Phycisphaerae bacterium]
MPCLIDKPVGIYRPPPPAESDFHRLVRDHFDDFRAAYPERYARRFGHWPPVFDPAVRKFLIPVLNRPGPGAMLRSCGPWTVHEHPERRDDSAKWAQSV